MKHVRAFVLRAAVCLLLSPVVAHAGAGGPEIPKSRAPFVHPPLKCMAAHTRIHEYPVMAWCFHGRRPTGRYLYEAPYVEDAKAAGFNVLIDSNTMLDPCRAVGGMMVLVPQFHHTPEALLNDALKKGDHPNLMGFILDDNCSRISGLVVRTATWMKQEYPHLIPFVSENPTPVRQAKTPVRVMGTQNYPFLRGGTGSRARQAYCSRLDYDREISNRFNMAQWPLSGGAPSPSEYRFQFLAATAYGAQGVIHFAYTPHRPTVWHPPGKPYTKMAHHANTYVWQVVGRHLYGTRCAGVYHSPGEDDVARGAWMPKAGTPVEAMDKQLLVGVLMVEKKFYAKEEGKTPDYLMVVDKRTSRGALPERDTWIEAGPGIVAVEILDRESAKAGALRKVEPGWRVPLRLLAGGGVLLRVNPADLDALLGKEQARRYREIVDAGSGLRALLAKEPPTAEAFDKRFADVMARAESMKAAVAGGSAQQKDAVDRLHARLLGIRQEAFRPRVASGEYSFIDTRTVELKTGVRDAAIHYTLDGSEPATSSPLYSKPFALRDSCTVKAIAVGSSPAAPAGSAAMEFTKVRGAVREAVTINFQPRGTGVPQGALPDYGDVFGLRQEGRAYGWNRSRAGTSRARGRSRDPFKRTLIGFQPGIIWEIALDKGTYAVTVCVGDVDYGIRGASIRAEDVEFFKDAHVGHGRNLEKTLAVTVNDGRLTLRSHDRDARDQRTRINYVKIEAK